MGKHYDILLDKIKIGTTELENNDASMGVVFGKIDLLDKAFGHSYFKEYCKANHIAFDDHPEDALILTRDIPGLSVVDSNGKEIKGLASSISGMDSEGFEVYLEGIPYPFYQKEFPHHVRNYDEKFKK